MTWAALARLRDRRQVAMAEALRLRQETARAHLALFETCDVLLTPSLGVNPAPLDTLSFNDLGSFEDWAEAGYGFAPFSIRANITGQPAASLPLPLAASEIPAGVQIIGRPECDLQVLRLSRQMEEVIGW